MREKRGQITLFVILGIVGLVVFGMMYFIVANISQSQIEQQVEVLEGGKLQIKGAEILVQQCLDRALIEGLDLLGKQGGRIYHEQGGLSNLTDYINYTVDNKSYLVSYMMKVDEDDRMPLYPCTEDVNEPKYCEFINDITEFHRLYSLDFGDYDILYAAGPRLSFKNQLEHFLENKTQDCIRMAELAGKNVNIGNVSADVKFTPNTVEADLVMPVEVELPGESAPRHDNFKYNSKQFVSISEYAKAMTEVAEKDSRSLDFHFKVDSTKGTFQRRPLKIITIAPKITQLENMKGFDDLFIFEDDRSRLAGKPYQFVVARENRPPALDLVKPEFESPFPIVDFIITSGDTIAFMPEAHDPDEDELTYKYKGWKADTDSVYNPVLRTAQVIENLETNSWETSDAYTKEGHCQFRCANYTVSFGDIGLHNVTIEVSDGEYTDSQHIRVWVKERLNIFAAGQNLYEDVDDNWAAAEEPYILSAKGVTQISGNRFYTWTDSEEFKDEEDETLKNLLYPRPGMPGVNNQGLGNLQCIILPTLDVCTNKAGFGLVDMRGPFNEPDSPLVDHDVTMSVDVHYGQLIDTKKDKISGLEVKECLPHANKNKGFPPPQGFSLAELSPHDKISYKTNFDADMNVQQCIVEMGCIEPKVKPCRQMGDFCDQWAFDQCKQYLELAESPDEDSPATAPAFDNCYSSKQLACQGTSPAAQCYNSAFGQCGSSCYNVFKNRICDSDDGWLDCHDKITEYYDSWKKLKNCPGRPAGTTLRDREIFKIGTDNEGMYYLVKDPCIANYDAGERVRQSQITKDEKGNFEVKLMSAPWPYFNVTTDFYYHDFSYDPDKAKYPFLQTEADDDFQASHTCCNDDGTFAGENEECYDFTLGPTCFPYNDWQREFPRYIDSEIYTESPDPNVLLSHQPPFNEGECLQDDIDDYNRLKDWAALSDKKISNNICRLEFKQNCSENRGNVCAGPTQYEFMTVVDCPDPVYEDADGDPWQDETCYGPVPPDVKNTECPIDNNNNLYSTDYPGCYSYGNGQSFELTFVRDGQPLDLAGDGPGDFGDIDGICNPGLHQCYSALNGAFVEDVRAARGDVLHSESGSYKCGFRKTCHWYVQATIDNIKEGISAKRQCGSVEVNGEMISGCIDAVPIYSCDSSCIPSGNAIPSPNSFDAQRCDGRRLLNLAGSPNYLEKDPETQETYNSKYVCDICWFDTSLTGYPNCGGAACGRTPPTSLGQCNDDYGNCQAMHPEPVCVLDTFNEQQFIADHTSGAGLFQQVDYGYTEDFSGVMYEWVARSGADNYCTGHCSDARIETTSCYKPSWQAEQYMQRKTFTTQNLQAGCCGLTRMQSAGPCTVRVTIDREQYMIPGQQATTGQMGTPINPQANQQQMSFRPVVRYSGAGNYEGGGPNYVFENKYKYTDTNGDQIAYEVCSPEFYQDIGTCNNILPTQQAVSGNWFQGIELGKCVKE